jgi:hypothetical protein
MKIVHVASHLVGKYCKRIIITQFSYITVQYTLDLIRVFAKRVVEMHVLIIGITKGWIIQPKQCQTFKLSVLSKMSAISVLSTISHLSLSSKLSHISK